MKKTTAPKKNLLLTSEKIRKLTTLEMEQVGGGWGCDGTMASAKPTIPCG